MLNKRILFLLIIVCLVCAALIAPHAFAQESTPDPTPPPISGGLLGDVPTPNDVFNGFVDWVGTLALAGGAVVVAITAAIKRMEAFANIPSAYIKAGVTLLLVIATYATNMLGIQAQFNDGLRVLLAILGAFGFTAVSAEAWYKAGVKDWPCIGTSRDIQLE